MFKIENFGKKEHTLYHCHSGPGGLLLVLRNSYFDLTNEHFVIYSFKAKNDHYYCTAIHL